MRAEALTNRNVRRFLNGFAKKDAVLANSISPNADDGTILFHLSVVLVLVLSLVRHLLHKKDQHDFFAMLVQIPREKQPDRLADRARHA